MHIADLTMFYAARSGGIRRYLEVKHDWLRRRAHRHTLVVPDRNGCVEDEATLALPSVPLPLSQGYRVPVGMRRAVRAMVDLKPHIIEAGDPYHLAWAALRVRDRLGAKALAFCHSDLPRLAERYGPRAERCARAYCRRLYGEFDVVLAPSAFLARALKQWGLPRVEQQALGVDTERFSPRLRTPAGRARLTGGDDVRLLVYAGRFAPEKNLDVVLRAMSALGAPYRLLLVGAGTLPRTLPANVTVSPYVGDRDRLAALLANCDAFVHAGDQETFGLAALEAMACGLPVVGARAAGVSEIVGQGAGILVEPRNADALVEGVRRLFSEDRERLQAEARRIAERYAWNPLLEQMLARYRRLAS